MTVLPVVAAFTVAVLAAVALARAFGPPSAAGRVASLDGLRGYLALAVFVHHARLWSSVVRGGRWDIPESDALYSHLGQGSVTLFFLMTGFLFGAKLVEARRRPIDWSRVYVARVLRIYPLYGVVLAATLATIAALSGFERRVDMATLVRNLVAWSHFADPDINGVPDSWMIVAGVTWSLMYEWLFYSALPIAALLFGRVAPVGWLAVSALGMAAWAHWIPSIQSVHLGAFGGGVLALLLTRRAAVRATLAGPIGAPIALTAVAIVLTCFVQSYQWPVLALLTLAFTVVASGNTLFGALSWAPSRLLGEISYGIYLLHGLLLFVVLRSVIGLPAAAALSPAAYWALIVALAPLLVVVAFAAFRLVEYPAIRATPRMQHRVAGWLARARSGREEPLADRHIPPRRDDLPRAA